MEEFSRVFPEWMEAGSEHLHRRADGAARGAEHNLERSVWGSAAKPTLQGQPDPAPGLFQAFRVSPGYWVVSQQCRRWGGPGSPGFGDNNSPAALAAVDPGIPGENRPWKGWDGRQELPSSQFFLAHAERSGLMWKMFLLELELVRIHLEKLPLTCGFESF